MLENQLFTPTLKGVIDFGGADEVKINDVLFMIPNTLNFILLSHLLLINQLHLVILFGIGN